MLTMEAVGALMLLGAAYCLGGLHGLWLAWTQPVRMKRWADKACEVSDRLYELEQKGQAK